MCSRNFSMTRGLPHVVVLVMLIFCHLSLAYVDENQRPENGAYQYQSSFSGPFGGTHIPFWETSGAAVVMDNYVRLTTNKQSLRGAIWTTRPMRNRDWEIHMQFSIGSEARVGADGMALWYTKDRAIAGPVMGNTDRWSGIGVIIDTFDNDGQRDNPQIYAVYNDRSFPFQPSTDGKEKTLGICQASVRQISPTPENKIGKLLVRLKDKILTVSYDISGLTNAQSGWTTCFSVPVPIDDQLTGYYLGLTAETGGLTDYHDVKSITTWSIRSTSSNQPTDEEMLQDYKKKIELEANKMKEPTMNNPLKDQPTYRKKMDSDDPATEIVNRLMELEKRDDTFSTTIEVKFKEIQIKLETMEKEQTQTLQRLQQGLESIRSGVDVNRIEELKRDVKTALSSLQNVQQRIDQIDTHVAGTNQRTQDLHGLHDTRSNELRELVERTSSWGFWTYFMIFQVFFWCAFVWWKKTQDDKTKKFL
eukprot:TRINITY_DN10677_c0_g1_i1.p1 TRINITY_DN10677_c0_g1~~TRINITY_DN10677_c0_g1_i1.p1  ORF type:complete len:475 (+),score=71.37 TRINITY_DN10677_c0_g1_i1:95-1519(+)